ncbi:alpha/beta fold hydrolase [Streptomyces sp. NPDC056987]|uniref:alpha/beta fold hydrolase n=1 Tax=Streptomyces sp. NPDC056987 TaxID=3345988 RepID=UPI003642E2D7
MPVRDRRAAVRPALVLDRTAARPRAVVLVLHGGRSESERPPTRLNLPGARMLPFTRAVLRATEGHDVVVGRVRYRHRGWNGTRADAARDARRALDELEQLVGPVPVVLVGHSMGGRAALAAAGHEQVVGVVGLAPWCPPGEPVGQLAGRRVVLLHGDRDRTTDPRESVALAARARDAGAEACAVLLSGGDHPMLRRAGTWHALGTGSVTGLLGLGRFPAEVADAFLRAAAGEETDPVQRV